MSTRTKRSKLPVPQGLVESQSRAIVHKSLLLDASARVACGRRASKAPDGMLVFRRQNGAILRIRPFNSGRAVPTVGRRADQVGEAMLEVCSPLATGVLGTPNAAGARA